MTDPTEIARIAKGLTRAQREVLASATHRPLTIVGDWVVHPGNCRAAMANKGLVAKGIRSWSSRKPSKPIWVPTPLGLLVRDHILREKIGGGGAA